MIRLLFTLAFLPFKILSLMVKVLAELVEHAGHHQRRHGRVRRHPRGRRSRPTIGAYRRPGSHRRLWQVLGVLFIIGFIGVHPVAFGVLAAVGIGGFLLIRQQTVRREAEEQKRRHADEEAQQARAQLLAALRPEDVAWLSSVGWEGDAQTPSHPPAATA